MFTELTPDLVLQAYQEGIFPMADSQESLYFNFYRPEMRGLLPIQNLHIPKKLLKTLKQDPYHVTIDHAFEEIIDGCALKAKGRDSTWINKPIREAFIDLHKMGYAHSVECWDNEKLAGGLYGLAIGRVFCGESMVSFFKDASKIALIHLVARLHAGKFKILDTQFINDHLKQFGAYEISQDDYERCIEKEMKKKADFYLKEMNQDDLVKIYLRGCKN